MPIFKSLVSLDPEKSPPLKQESNPNLPLLRWTPLPLGQLRDSLGETEHVWFTTSTSVRQHVTYLSGSDPAIHIACYWNVKMVLGR